MLVGRCNPTARLRSMSLHTFHTVTHVTVPHLVTLLVTGKGNEPAHEAPPLHQANPDAFVNAVAQVSMPGVAHFYHTL
jgi:hypothetical protein